VRSRGLKARPGQLAAKKVRDYAQLRGYDLSNSRSTLLEAADVAWADVLLYMDTGNLRRLETAGWQQEAVCLGQYVGAARIPDPNFLPRGPALNSVLDLVVAAAEAAGRTFLHAQ